MSSQRRIHPEAQAEPDVYFLPLVPRKATQLPGVDVELACRRIPDLLHHLINGGEPGPTRMVERQTPPAEEVRAVVGGTLRTSHEGFELVVWIHFRPDRSSRTVRVTVDTRNPLPPLARLARRLAAILELPYRQPLGCGRSAPAFYRLLEGLDGPPDKLLAACVKVLFLDRAFPLALRIVRETLVRALEDGQLDRSTCRSVLDDCLRARPEDGEAAVAVAGLLHRLGEDERAIAWLEHAAGLPVPQGRALQALGFLLLERKPPDRERTRALWQKGAEVDGDPDFCAHLARLAFGEGDLVEGWLQVERGLLRFRERGARPQEWLEANLVTRGAATLLLRCVAEQLVHGPPPRPVAELLDALREGGVLGPEERVELGICLVGMGLSSEGRAELQAGLGMDPDVDARDRGVRAMLALDVPAFERRFQVATETIRKSRQPGRGMRTMREFLIREPEFWPALFHLAVGLRRQDRTDEALDALAEVLQLHPAQPEALVEMAELFAARGNPKRALECVDEALRTHEREAQLHLRRAAYLERLDRPVAAAAATRRALELEDSGEWREATGAWAQGLVLEWGQARPQA